MNSLSLKGVSKVIRDNEVLIDINLEFKKGKIYGIVGGNGCGKTMLFRTISGLIKPTTGSILIDNEEHKGLVDSIGCVIENTDFIPYYSGFTNLKLLAKIKNKINDTVINRYLDMVELTKFKNMKVEKYSLGMRQKLSIAQALMEDPDLLLLDEPFNALDENSKSKIMNIILEMKDEKIILITSHYGSDINYVCDEVVNLENGKVVDRGEV